MVEDKYDLSKRNQENELYRSLLLKIINTYHNNVKYLEPLDELPHMEPRLRKIFIETYLMTTCGFPNISIILQGVLLEQLVKEIIFSKERNEFQRAFGPAIERCEKKGYLNKHEIRYLNDYKNMIRNFYQHGDVTGLTKKSTVKGWKIEFNSKEPEKMFEKIENSIKNIRQGKIKPEDYSVTNIRPVGLIIKNVIDEDIYYNEFMFMDIFVRKICEKYMPP